MQKNPSDGSQVKTVAALSSDYNGLGIQAGIINLGSNDGVMCFGDTDYTGGFGALLANMPTQGSGNSPASPQNFVVLITDGVQDVPGPWVDGHCTAALDPKHCDPLKLKAMVATIYTTCQPIMKNAYSTQMEDTCRDLVFPFATKTRPEHGRLRVVGQPGSAGHQRHAGRQRGQGPVQPDAAAVGKAEPMSRSNRWAAAGRR